MAQKISMWRHKNEGLSIYFLGFFFPTSPVIFLIFMTLHIWFLAHLTNNETKFILLRSPEYHKCIKFKRIITICVRRFGCLFELRIFLVFTYSHNKLLQQTISDLGRGQNIVEKKTSISAPPNIILDLYRLWLSLIPA